jgi:Ca-activated chloride channel family protein
MLRGRGFGLEIASGQGEWMGEIERRRWCSSFCREKGTMRHREASRPRFRRSLKRRFLKHTLTLFGIFALSVSAAAGPQTPPRRAEARDRDQGRFQFTVDVRAVNLNVVVTDKNGRYVPGLEASQFEVLEDGLPQELSFFSPEVTPLTVLLLLDASTSMRPSLNGVKEAAANFVRKLWEGDRAIVADFNDKVRFSTHFTSDVDRLIQTIESLYPSGWTALYDSILICADKLSGTDGRRALLVFTDGDDSRSQGFGSEASAEDAVEGGKLSEVTIYSVGFRGGRGSGGGLNKGFLKRLARETGGEAFFPAGIGELNESFSRIQEELHSQYRLAFVPRDPARRGWRKIEVRIKGRDDLVARTRTGYYARGGPPATEQ